MAREFSNLYGSKRRSIYEIFRRVNKTISIFVENYAIQVYRSERHMIKEYEIACGFCEIIFENSMYYKLYCFLCFNEVYGLVFLSFSFTFSNFFPARIRFNFIFFINVMHERARTNILCKKRNSIESK